MAYHLLMQFSPLPKLQWQFSKQYFFNQRTRNSFHQLLISSNTDGGRWDFQELKKFSLSINHGIYITNNLKLYKIIITTENLELCIRMWNKILTYSLSFLDAGLQHFSANPSEFLFSWIIFQSKSVKANLSRSLSCQ